MRASVLALVLCGCPDDPGFTYHPDTDDTDLPAEESEEPEDTDDTEPQGTDEDQDGWTVEEGDCDDTSIWVNPAWTEVEDDDLDNDCDGKIDEEFAGVTVIDVGATTRRQTIDSFGDLDDTVPLTEVVYAGHMVELPTGAGWAAVDISQMKLFEIAPDGEVTELWSLEEDAPEPIDELWGYATGLGLGPDGAYYVSGYDRVWRIEPGGMTETIAVFACDLETDAGTELCVKDVAVDRFTGEVAMFGLLGGFGVWTADEGVVIHAKDQPESYTTYVASGAMGPDGTPFALGIDIATGENKMYAWDGAGLVVHGDWPDDDFSPVDFAIDQESGDLFVTANGGWNYTVWKMFADGSYTTPLFQTGTEDSEPDRAFWAIETVYTQDE